MVHLPDLIQDLAIILTTAAIVTLLFRALRQPVVLGYLIAGFLIGPHFHLFPTVKDEANIRIWAEIGVIFLLFGLGLEFSFKKLAKVGKSASITATFEILAMLGIGYATGKVLGWSNMDSLFLGGILSISSTTIIVRAFDELGLKGRGFVSLVFGVLIVEDLLAILLLVLLSSVAATQALSGEELFASSFRLVFFLSLWFLLGIYLLPTFIVKAKRLLNNETILIFSLGLCLLMVIISSHSGFSPALGAFVMGSLLAETREGHRIEHLILPVKDLFSAIFFVSVGMLIDPFVLTEYAGVILLITAVTIVGKLLSTTMGALLSGSSLRNSMHAGMSLAQIGEFSFIIATLGTSLKVTSDFLYPVAVAVSAVTTFTTPYLIKGSGTISDWIERKIPRPVADALHQYETAMAPNSHSNLAGVIWKEYGLKIVLNATLVIAITLGVRRWGLPLLTSRIETNFLLSAAACAVALTISVPFLWAVLFSAPSTITTYNQETITTLRRLQPVISIVRFLAGSVLIAFVVGSFTSVWAVTGGLLLIMALLTAFFGRHAQRLYLAMEHRFLANLSESERSATDSEKKPELAPWNATLAEFNVSPHSTLVAKSLEECKLRERFGVTVAMIERGQSRILAPTRKTLLLPYDKVSLIGTDEQLETAREVIESPDALPNATNTSSFGLTSLKLSAEDPFVNKNIRECGLREAIDGLIVGIERKGARTLNPDSSVELRPDDLLWVVGDLSRIKALRSGT